MKRLILVINPGSTSTKLALFRDNDVVVEQTLRHDVNFINTFKHLAEQKQFRLDAVLAFLKDNRFDISEIDCFVGRGGLVKPLKHGGTYIINETMLYDLEHDTYGSHASNLGAIIAYGLAQIHHKPSFIVDPVAIDEMHDLARVSGLKGIDRKSAFHALNHKAIAKRYAREHNTQYDKLNLIIAHLGGGISVAYHHLGRVVDVNNALGGDGPFSPERSGGLPCFPLIDLCFQEGMTPDEVKRRLVRKGGLLSYLDTNDGFELARRIETGDEEARFYMQAMAYQVVKEIGALYFIASGEIDAVILTGGLAYFKDFIDRIMAYMTPIVNVEVYPGEDEMRSLLEGALRVLDQKEQAHTYQ